MNKKVSALSDQQLLSAYLSGDKDAISILIERHSKRVLDYIRMMVKNNEVADDIYQETFIKVVRFIDDGRYTDNGKFLSWVLRIAHNQVIDHFRQAKQQNNLSESDAGYDIVNDLDGVLAEFDRVIGLDRLKALHLNDSKNPCGAHKDRHEKLGQGCLGLEMFRRILHHPALRGLPMILETPNELPGYAQELALLRALGCI